MQFDGKLYGKWLMFCREIDFYECIANIVSPNELNDVPWQIITTIIYSMVFSRRIVADES